MSDQTPVIVAAIGAIGAILAAAIAAVAAIVVAYLHYKETTLGPMKGPQGEAHLKEVERSARRKRATRNSLIAFVVSGAAATVFTWISQWGIHLAVAGVGALVAIVFVALSAIAIVAFETIRSRPTALPTQEDQPARSSLTKIVGFFLLAAGTAFFWFALGPRAGISEIRIAQAPFVDSNGGPEKVDHIEGRVSGVNPAKFRIVIYAHTNEWYVQPFATSPLTGINGDGSWENDTHLGDRYAALLVKPSYQPPQITDALPNIGGDVVATTNMAPSSRKEAAR
jgi:hypothetical protein